MQIQARNDVMLAHYAVRHNIIHAVNITAAGNITLIEYEDLENFKFY